MVPPMKGRVLLRSKVATLVTTRSSGSSYLNRVELQNGCLSLAHSNTFIPSTLAGLCIDQQTLQRDHPETFSEFEIIWEVRKRHIVPNLPQQYIFFSFVVTSLTVHIPCSCQIGRPESPYWWYPQGPPITTLPLPIADPKRPWGSSMCSTCKGFCSGHYLPPTYIYVTDSPVFAKPPSSVCKELLLERKKKKQQQQKITDDFAKSAAQKTLLTPEEARIWISHLQIVDENHRRGAAKAAQTRNVKKKSSDTCS